MLQFQTADVVQNLTLCWLRAEVRRVCCIVRTRQILCRQQALAHLVLLIQGLFLSFSVDFKELLTRDLDLG